MNFRAQAAAGVRWTSVSSFINAASDVIRTVVLARFLSPEDFGMMAMVAVVIGFAQTYMDMGVSAAIIHRQNATREQLSSLYWLNLSVGLIVFGLVWMFLPWIPVFLRETRILPLFKVMSAVFLIVPLGSQFEILLQKELRFNVVARYEIIASLTGTIVAVVCAVSGFGVWTLVFALLANVTVKTLLLIRTGLGQFRPSFHFSRGDLQGYLRFGFFQMGERSVNYLAERLDQLLIGPLLGAHALGLYNFALYLTAQPVSRINPILTKVAFPLFSKIQHDDQALRRGYLKLLSLDATLNAPLLLGLAVVAPVAVPTIFGEKWLPSVVLVQILSIVSLSRSIGNPIGSLQLAKGRADLGFWWNVLLLVCSVPAVYMGGEIGQATGVAVALLVLQLSLNVPAYLLLVRPLIGNCARAYASATLKPTILAAAMAITVWGLGVLLKELPARTELTAQIGAGAIVYLGLLVVFYKAEAEALQSFLIPTRFAGAYSAPSR